MSIVLRVLSVMLLCPMALASAADLPLPNAPSGRIAGPPADAVATIVPSPPTWGCTAGYTEGAAGGCLRHGELDVACDPEGCRPLPPDPMPYGLGAAQRLDY